MIKILKIKDNIDLKELEKFGYELLGNQYCLWNENPNPYMDEIENPQFLVIIGYKRQITLYENDTSYIEDLIQARFSRKSRGVINNEYN